MKALLICMLLSAFFVSSAFAFDGCELLAKKRKIGEHLLQVQERIGLKDVYLCDDHKLYDVRSPKTLLTESLVNYAEVTFSPSGNKVAWIESHYRGPGKYQDLVYRVVVYDLVARKRRIAREDTSQIHQYKWSTDHKLQYSYEYRGVGKKGWFDIELIEQ